MIEVDWSKAPEWANFHAIDENGLGMWYKKMPVRNNKWWFNNDSLSDIKGVSKSYKLTGIDWRETLTQRPGKEQSNTSGWIDATKQLPKPLQTVWITNGVWVDLGCLIESDGGYHWAQSNGILYPENGEIVAECESYDLDVKYWHEVPKMPKL